MFTLLHLSDLHRAAAEPISNDEIMSSLISDRARLGTEQPPIATPDAIIVSGDLVQGLPPRSLAYPEGLMQQYDAALDLLTRLADAFLEGDRSRLVMIPGNHDVDFNQSLESMVEVKAKKADVQGLLFAPGPENPYRWSWSEGKLYRIGNAEQYEDRFKYYCDTFSNFYDRVPLAYDVDPFSYSNVFELDAGRIVVVAFNSCNGNDCFNSVGDIPRAEIARSHLRIAETGKPYRLKMAVWHHDLSGPPRRSDYMDKEIVKLMIDKGFRLGLHGHQHKANAAPESIYTATRTSMVVVGAGSLCAGTFEVPRGVSRQYNIIEIATDHRSARVHVREAKVTNIFTRGRFIDLDDASFQDLEWTPEEGSQLQAEGARATGEPLLARVERIESLIAEGRAAEALAQLELDAKVLGRHGRLLVTKALVEAKDWPNLQHHLTLPESADELTQLVTALVRQKLWQQAKDLLRAPIASNLLSGPNVTDLEQLVNAEEAMSR
jgi:hypothetical protein